MASGGSLAGRRPHAGRGRHRHHRCRGREYFKIGRPDVRDLHLGHLAEARRQNLRGDHRRAARPRGMQRLLDRAKMRHTKLNAAWGLTQLTAGDELILLKLLSSRGHVLGAAARRYVRWLMAHVVPDQRWGVSAGAPSDVTVHIKNGWLPYPVSSDWHINSIGIFTGHDIEYQIAVLTDGNPSMAYGIDTIQRAARVINHDLAGR
jgi:hypothetical protein